MANSSIPCTQSRRSSSYEYFISSGFTLTMMKSLERHSSAITNLLQIRKTEHYTAYPFVSLLCAQIRQCTCNRKPRGSLQTPATPHPCSSREKRLLIRSGPCGCLHQRGSHLTDFREICNWENRTKISGFT